MVVLSVDSLRRKLLYCVHQVLAFLLEFAAIFLGIFLGKNVRQYALLPVLDV